MWKQSCPHWHLCPKPLFTSPSRLVTSQQGQLSLFSVAVVWPELVLKEALAQSIQITLSSLCLNKATGSCKLYIIYLLWSSAAKLCLWRQEKQTKRKINPRTTKGKCPFLLSLMTARRNILWLLSSHGPLHPFPLLAFNCSLWPRLVAIPHWFAI